MAKMTSSLGEQEVGWVWEGITVRDRMKMRIRIRTRARMRMRARMSSGRMTG